DVSPEFAAARVFRERRRTTENRGPRRAWFARWGGNTGEYFEGGATPLAPGPQRAAAALGTPNAARLSPRAGKASCAASTALVARPFRMGVPACSTTIRVPV